MKIIAAFLLVALCGCAALTSGTDPLVVRTEQTETVAYSTFDTFLVIDNANRALIQSNAPAVHAFAEQLRKLVPDGTNTVPQGILWILQLDRVKQAYKSGIQSSNALVTALAVVETAVSSAQTDITLYQSK